MSEKVPLFRYSWEEAKRNKAEQDWRLSQNENYRCARDIEKAINDNFDGKHLNGDCVKPVLEQYGFNRVMWVLAATLKEQSHDGRFSPENKSWSDTFYIPKEKGRREYEVRSHPAVLDGFITQTRQMILQQEHKPSVRAQLHAVPALQKKTPSQIGKRKEAVR